MAVESVKDVFATHLPNRLQQKPDLAEKINCTYKFIVTGDNGGTWVLDLTKPGGVITEGDSEAQCTLTVTDADFVDMINGKLNPQMAFMGGKLKIAGDMSLALKLGSVLG